MERINQVYLAGGFGTRLKEEGVNKSKGLIEYDGEHTILGFLIEKSKELGSNLGEIALVTNNRFYEDYMKYLASNYSDLNIQVINNGVNNPEDRKGAIGDLIFALDYLKWWDSSVFVLAVDTLVGYGFLDLFKFYQEHKGEFVTVFREFENESYIAKRLGCAAEIKNGRVIEFIEKPEDPPTLLGAIPAYIYPKQRLDDLRKYQKEGGNLDAPGSIISWFIKNNIPVYGFVFSGPSIDVGTKEDLKRAEHF